MSLREHQAKILQFPRYIIVKNRLTAQRKAMRSMLKRLSRKEAQAAKQRLLKIFDGLSGKNILDPEVLLPIIDALEDELARRRRWL